MAETLSQIRSKYTFDANALRYRGTSGRFVSAKAIKQSLNSFVRRVAREAVANTRRMLAGQLPIDEWQRLHANAVKSSHLAMRAVAKGGWAQMTQADYGAVGAEMRKQYRFLARFAIEVERGGLPGGTVLARAEMYLRSASGSYERGRFDGFRDLAATGVAVEMKNRLGKGEHCEGGNGRPGCLEESSRGWVPLGDLSLPGSRRCLTRCLCTCQYRIR